MVRTFIAVQISDTVRENLANLIADLRSACADVRWVSPENLHLTLKFLGDLEEKRIDEVAQAVSRACRGFAPFAMSLQALGAFPSPKGPRVVWVGVVKGKDDLISLNESIETELEQMGFEKEKRKYSPHLTIGRLRREGRPVDLADILSVGFDGGECVVDRVCVMKSTLTPRGPVYEELQRTILGTQKRGSNGKEG
ncbi:MAG: RNA 2',3'-cyclic phosphodiesterase [bacterium]